ncbi:MAG TPA: hypothetical protein VKZ81_19020 [Pseudonocardia sp.]|jgi:hypothetical protein|uniref:hypothetical protein n=1 Tax=Pseudonocardia sp. TaxID=60912 RepID=UPI002B4AD78C|nr:hypothetical protein [Pseudonocardia sp.]HLU57553.1 hypothetical protein [Pseudonocardia sp.]
MLLVWVTVGVGTALLVVLLLVVLRHVRRFARAKAALEADVARQVGELRALADERRQESA